MNRDEFDRLSIPVFVVDGIISHAIQAGVLQASHSEVDVACRRGAVFSMLALTAFARTVKDGVDFSQIIAASSLDGIVPSCIGLAAFVLKESELSLPGGEDVLRGRFALIRMGLGRVGALS